MRIACVYIPHLAATVALRRRPDLRGRPAVIADQATGTPRIVDATPAAAGVVAGMTLTAALARCPEARVGVLLTRNDLSRERQHEVVTVVTVVTGGGEAVLGKLALLRLAPS